MKKLNDGALRTLIAAIYEAGLETSHSSAPDYVRSQLETELKMALLDQNGLTEYLKVLQEVLQRQPIDERVLEGESLHGVLSNGLSALSDRELVRLALNPLALMNLFDRILDTDEPSQYWLDALYELTT